MVIINTNIPIKCSWTRVPNIYINVELVFDFCTSRVSVRKKKNGILLYEIFSIMIDSGEEKFRCSVLIETDSEPMWIVCALCLSQRSYELWNNVLNSTEECFRERRNYAWVFEIPNDTKYWLLQSKKNLYVLR